MKICMYIGYHDANNVSHFGDDPVTQLNKLKRLKMYLRCFTVTARDSRDAAPVLRLLLREARRLLEYGRPTPASNGHTSLSTALV